jgi:hypothetical protein
MRPKPYLLAAAVAAALLITACGGSSSRPLSAAEFSADANSICKSDDALLRKLTKGFGPSVTKGEHIGASINTVLNKIGANLSQLSGPPALNSARATLVADGQALKEIVNATVQNLKTKDPARAVSNVVANFQAANKLASSATNAARTLKAPACGQFFAVSRPMSGRSSADLP